MSTLARSRRLLNRAWEISGASDGDAVHVTVRERLKSGALFPAPRTIWMGQGTGRICFVCDAAITALKVEAETTDGPATVRAHLECYTIWRQESDAMPKAAQQSDTSRTT
jgi:hypothetical protein